MEIIKTKPVSPFMDMVLGYLAHQETILSTKDQLHLFPFYDRLFRSTMEVYNANKIPITKFCFVQVDNHYTLTINVDQVVIIPGTTEEKEEVYG